MNTSASSLRLARRAPGSEAFTLIELLVVISIIAVLAGLLLPVVGAVQNNAKKVSCRATEMSIIAAINSYQTEYSQYPVPSDAGTGDFTYTSDGTNNNGQLFNVLRAINSQDPGATTGTLNSRRINYFEARNVKSQTSPRDGFILTDTPTPKGNLGVTLAIGDLVDPFGNLYCVRMDSNYNNVLVNPYKDDSKSTDTTGTSATPSAAELQAQLRTGVIAYSYGIDGKRGKNGNTVTAPYTPVPGDDVDSWQ